MDFNPGPWAHQGTRDMKSEIAAFVVHWAARTRTVSLALQMETPSTYLEVVLC